MRKLNAVGLLALLGVFGLLSAGLFQRRIVATSITRPSDAVLDSVVVAAPRPVKSAAVKAREDHDREVWNRELDVEVEQRLAKLRGQPSSTKAAGSLPAGPPAASPPSSPSPPQERSSTADLRASMSHLSITEKSFVCLEFSKAIGLIRRYDVTDRAIWVTAKYRLSSTAEKETVVGAFWIHARLGTAATVQVKDADTDEVLETLQLAK